MEHRGAREPHVQVDVRQLRQRPRLRHRRDHHARGAPDHDLEHQARQCGRGDTLMTAAVDRVSDVQATTGRPDWLAKVDAGRILTHLSLLFLVVLWTFPTAGLLISSLRDKDQLAVSGWWTALTSSVSQDVVRLPTADGQIEENGKYVIRGNLFGDDTNKRLSAFGTSGDAPAATPAGGSMPMSGGGAITVEADGAFDWVSDTRFEHTRGPRVFFVAEIPPRFTLDNYVEVLTSSGVFRSFINS